MLAAGELYSLDYDGNTPLYYALVCDNVECIDVIFEYFSTNPRDYLITPRDVVFLLKNQSSLT